MEITQYINKDRVWDISKYHLKLLIKTFKVTVIQGHEVKEKPNRKLWIEWCD